MARKILLADDSVTAQNMGRKILADAGYEVITVNNGSAALKRITEIKPDLIVLDVYMPGYSGLEVCQRLKDAAETAHIPVLLTVGKLEPFKPEESRRVRADGHIVKPFEASELLTAITRLEDRIIPPQGDGSHFSASVSGVERFGGDGIGRDPETSNDADTGWKSRLRFPSKKKKEEPEPEPDDFGSAATFRDFRKTKAKGKSGSSLAFTVKEPAPAGQEPGLVPDIPRDITPEELDALSALAAKLDGPIPAAEEVEPLAEKMGPANAPSAEIPAVAEKEVAQRERDKDKDKEVPQTELPEPEVEVASAGTKSNVAMKGEAEEIESPASIVNGPSKVVVEPARVVSIKSGVEEIAEDKPSVVIPVEHTEPASEIAAASLTVSAETHKSPTKVEPPTLTVNAASLAEPPAPIDRSDEPMFETMFESAIGAVAAATENLPSNEVEPKDESKLAAPTPAASAVVVEASKTAAGEALGSVEAAVASPVESKLAEPGPETPKLAESSGGTAKPEQSEVAQLPQAASETTVVQACESDEPAPSDEELAEALRLLTPSTSSAEVTNIPSHGTLVAAGQLLAEEVARHASAGPRWMAEHVALTADEAALSLEAEMFRAFSAAPDALTVNPEPVHSAGVSSTGVSAITAAVEHRLATFDLLNNIAPARTEETHTAVLASSEPATEVASTESTTTSREVIGVPDANRDASETRVPEPEQRQPELNEHQDIETSGKETVSASVQVAEEAQADDERMGGTFADAIGSNAQEANEPEATPEAISDRPSEPVLGMASDADAAAKVLQGNQESSSEVGGEDMASKSGKSTWHQIRTAPAPSAAAGTDVVEAAKQAQGGAEETPKAMAAAAAEGSSSASSSTSTTTDAGTIASIVDSVMADLRPRIVEEIAKKLAGK